MKRQVLHKVGGRFFLQELIGKSPRCDVYRGEHVSLHKSVAIKIERVGHFGGHLAREQVIFKALQGCPGIPKIDWYGREGESDMLVLELTGRTFDQILKEMPGQTFSLKTVLMIAEQAICMIEYIHRSGFIYRNFSPENIAVGVGEGETNIFMLGFGLAVPYRDPETQEHEKYHEGLGPVGDPVYASLNTDVGIEQSRRDDMESLGYFLIHLLKGKLPWEDLNCDEMCMLERVAEAKMMTSYETLCERLPNEFLNYFQIVRSLRFDEEPPYTTLKDGFRDLFLRSGFVFDCKYDWVAEDEKTGPGRARTMPKIHAPLFDNREFGLTNSGFGGLLSPQRRLISSQMVLRPERRSTLVKAKKKYVVVSRRSLTLRDFGLNGLVQSTHIATPPHPRGTHNSARSKP